MKDKRKFLALALLLVPLVGCGDGEFSRMIPLGGGGGGSYSAPAPAPTMVPRSVGQPGYQQLPATGASKMLTDPEAIPESDSTYVWADDDAQAAQMCDQAARSNGGTMDSVTPSNVKEWRNSWGKRRYICYFTRYVEGQQ